MRALTYHGSHDVRVEQVPDPLLQDADDIIVRVSATAICGSDLHIYRGTVPGVKAGDVLGHEFMGEVVEAGPAVTAVRKGDRVVVPFVIACGSCFFCEKQLFAACETTLPNHGTVFSRRRQRTGAALFGFGADYGSMPGGQAEYVRVPKANSGPLKVPDGLDDEQVLFLSDILPTGYQALLNADVPVGGSLAIFGAGPVGQMTAACARLAGAGRIFVIDHHEDRLAFAARHAGAETINFDKVDPAGFLLDETRARGVDAVVDAVGYEAKGSALETTLGSLKAQGGSGEALRQCIAAVRRGGTVSVPGLYAGALQAFGFGDIFEKGLTVRAGQTHVQKYLKELLDAIVDGDLKPQLLISHRLKLDRAADGYRMFDQKEDGCRKVVLTP
jgi:threonine dehydrogenase-like Zn-dependent dehydrogenase